MLLRPLQRLTDRNHARSEKPLNLALQGGGAHGAFTWGVLERLLEDDRPRFAGVSGTSAGAMNAVVLAAGLLEGGRDGARAKLEAFWRGVSEAARLSPLARHPLDLTGEASGGGWSTNHFVFDAITRYFSPYQLNPLDFNPLRDLLGELVDFKRLRRQAPLRLFVAATEVSSGDARVFETPEISIDAVLASACLPHLHRAVKVGRRHYWDGGYSANPAILPLVRSGPAEDTLLVQIDPTRQTALPTKAPEILGRLNRIVFNAPLRREIELIEQSRLLAREGVAFGGRQRRRMARHRFHHIEAARVTADLDPVSKLTPDWGFVCHLRDAGREAAEAWLRKHFAMVGRRSTVDLAAKFLQPAKPKAANNGTRRRARTGS